MIFLVNSYYNLWRIRSLVRVLDIDDHGLIALTVKYGFLRGWLDRDGIEMMNSIAIKTKTSFVLVENVR